jgi:hypothetical protein
MVRNIALFFLMLVPSMTYAQLDSQFVFSGQNAEFLKAEKKVSIVTSTQVQVPSMCSRQVPYQENVCKNVTRYRQDCHWVAAHEVCTNQIERECDSVPRSRQVCASSGSETVCTDVPSREVCTERPEREVCRTRSDGTQSCNTVGGGTHCTTVGGGQSCRQVPGQRECHTEYYNEEVCSNVSRRVCQNVPRENVCESVPYVKNECAMETKYRLETYACTETQTVNRTTEVSLKSEINVQILTNGLVEEFPVAISIKEVSSDYQAFTIAAKLLKEPKLFVILKKKEVKVASRTEKEILLQSSVVLEVMTKEMLPFAFPKAIVSASIEGATSKLTIVFDGALSAQGAVDLMITHKAFLRSLKTMAEMKAEYPSAKVEVGSFGEKAALSINLKESIKHELESRNMLLKFNLTSALNLQGEIMNMTKPVTSKLYEGTFVQLK